MAQDTATVRVTPDQIKAFVREKGFEYTIKGKDGEKDTEVKIPSGEESVLRVFRDAGLLNKARQALIDSLSAKGPKAPRKDREARIAHFLLLRSQDRHLEMYGTVPYDQRLERDGTYETFQMMAESSDEPHKVLVLVQSPTVTEGEGENLRKKTSITIEVYGENPMDQVVNLFASSAEESVLVEESSAAPDSGEDNAAES